MDKKTFEFIKNKYGLHASWAIWAEESDTPTSNMEDLSVFEDRNILSELNPNIILVGLNFSVAGVVQKPFQNFHGTGGGAYKLRYALKGTPFWGAYMTDIIKDFPEADSNNVMRYLRNNVSLVEENILTFEEEIKDIGSTNPLIVGLGGDAHKILKKHLGSKFNIIKAMHYSHFINKENYKEKIKPLINDYSQKI